MEFYTHMVKVSGKTFACNVSTKLDTLEMQTVVKLKFSIWEFECKSIIIELIARINHLFSEFN